MKIFHKGIVMCAWMLGSWLYIPAQVPKTIKLSEVLEAVMAHAPKLVTDSAGVAIQEARLKEARYNWLPAAVVNYQVNLGTNNNLPGGYFSYGVVPSNSRVRNEGSASTILTDLGIAAFQWDVIDFGARKAERNLVTAELATEKAKLRVSKYEMQATVVNNYLQLLQISRLIEIQRLNIDRNIEIRKSIQSLARNGIVAGVDTSIAEAELSKSRLNLIEMENQQQQIQLQLAAISGIKEQVIFPDTSLVRKLTSRAAELSIPDPDSMNHPLLSIYRARYNQLKLGEQSIRRNFLPKLTLSAAVWGRGSSVTANDEFKSLPGGLGFGRGNYLAGIGISYDLLNGKRKKLALDVQDAEITYAARKIDEQDALLKLGFRQADSEVEIARRRFEEIPRQLRAAQAAYRQKLSLYKNGLNDIVELNAAAYILYRAETDYILAENSLCKAIFQKAFMENTVDKILAIIQ